MLYMLYAGLANQTDLNSLWLFNVVGCMFVGATIRTRLRFLSDTGEGYRFGSVIVEHYHDY